MQTREAEKTGGHREEKADKELQPTQQTQTRETKAFSRKWAQVLERKLTSHKGFVSDRSELSLGDKSLRSKEGSSTQLWKDGSLERGSKELESGRGEAPREMD